MFDKNEIIEMAREAGFWKYLFAYLEFKDYLEAFAKLVAAKEREAILKMCDPPEHSHQFVHTFKKLIAARGKT